MSTFHSEEEKSETLYQILDVAPDAKGADIKKQYRKLALQYHPDRQDFEEERKRCSDIFAKVGWID